MSRPCFCVTFRRVQVWRSDTVFFANRVYHMCTFSSSCVALDPPRHNVGFEVVDLLARRAAVELRPSPAQKAAEPRGRRAALDPGAVPSWASSHPQTGTGT